MEQITKLSLQKSNAQPLIVITKVHIGYQELLMYVYESFTEIMPKIYDIIDF